jgi:hypothetical protein
MHGFRFTLLISSGTINVNDTVIGNIHIQCLKWTRKYANNENGIFFLFIRMYHLFITTAVAFVPEIF